MLIGARLKGFSTTALAWSMLGALSNINRQGAFKQFPRKRAERLHERPDYGPEIRSPDDGELMSRQTRERTAERDYRGRFVKGSKAACEAGRKGGKLSSGSFAKGSERAREAGRKGGRR